MGKSPDSIGDEGIVAPREVQVPEISSSHSNPYDQGVWPPSDQVYWMTVADYSRTGPPPRHLSTSIEGRFAPSHIAEQNALGGLTRDDKPVPDDIGHSKDLPGEL